MTKKEGASVSVRTKSVRAAKQKTKNSTSQIKNPDQAFKTLDGKELKSILELVHELDTMADQVFYHHVTQERNDFANWVQDVFDEVELAKQLVQEKSKERTHIILLKHIVRKL